MFGESFGDVLMVRGGPGSFLAMCSYSVSVWDWMSGEGMTVV